MLAMWRSFWIVWQDIVSRIADKTSGTAVNLIYPGRELKTGLRVNFNFFINTPFACVSNNVPFYLNCHM